MLLNIFFICTPEQVNDTCRFRILQPFADLRGETLDEGVHLVAGCDWIMYDLHGVHQ